MGFRARKIFGSFEKRTPGLKEQNRLRNKVPLSAHLTATVIMTYRDSTSLVR